MDDPWGSPWTSSADHNSGNGNGNGNGSAAHDTDDGTPKPPQPAVLAGSLSGNTPFASLPEPSPWADDDGGGFGSFDDDNAFGDWTTADTHTLGTGGGAAAGASTPGSSGWGAFTGVEAEGFGADNGFGSSQHLSPQRKDKSAYGGLGQLSPIAWPSSAALSPAGSPGGSPRRRRALSRSSVNSLGNGNSGLGGFARSPSVDPWSTASTSERRDETIHVQDITRARAGSTLSIPILRLDDSNSASKGLDEGEAQTTNGEARVEAATKGVPQIVAEDVDDEDSADDDDKDDDDDDDTPTPPPQPIFPSIASSSRPSSSGSDGSSTDHHADINDPHQDSPTTSVEDDNAAAAPDTTTTTPRPHVIQRKSSSKVQGLVELFDGLSTRPAPTRSPSASSSTRDDSRHGSIVSDKSTDGDGSLEGVVFETPKTTVVVETPTNGPESPTSDSTLATPVAESKQQSDLLAETTLDNSDGDNDDDEEDERTSEDGSEADPEGIPREATPQENPQEGNEESSDEPPQATKAVSDITTKEKGVKTFSTTDAPETDVLSAARLLDLFGKQPYTFDKAKVDELYSDKAVTVRPRVQKENTEGGAPTTLDAFIPDYILDDSFTAISERKVWYRIARHGSSRKHAAGGDDNENYRPVTWRTSAIRDDTVKIVRRWMEEDSFTGKPTLGGFGRGFGGGAGGGGMRSGNLFGWDSAAVPVALDEVFKRKKTAASGHRQTLSTASSAWANEGSGASGDSPAEFSPGFSPSPVFGWGSNSNSHDTFPAKPESARNSAQFERPAPPVAAAVPSPTAPQPSRFSITLPPRDLAPTLPTATEKEDTGAFADGDDDDDWGEMISSPVKEELSIPPFAAPLSLPLAPVQTPAPAFAPAPAPSPAHAPTPQLDDSAVAALANSIIAGLPNLSYMAV